MDLLEFMMELRYLVLFSSEKYGSIYIKIRYLIKVKNDITNYIFHNYANIKVNLYDSLTLEVKMTFLLFFY